MKAAILACGVALASSASWGFLVAGSKTWDNYRHQVGGFDSLTQILTLKCTHQADVAHAYQTLTARGVPASNIITFMYDDLAQNDENPFPVRSAFHSKSCCIK